MCWDLWLWPHAILFPALQSSRQLSSVAGLTVPNAVSNSIHVSWGHSWLCPGGLRNGHVYRKTIMWTKLTLSRFRRVALWFFSVEEMALFFCKPVFPIRPLRTEVVERNDSFREAVELFLLVHKNLNDLKGSTRWDDGKFATEFLLSRSVFWC